MASENRERTGIIILAAGSSSRMSGSKQLLQLNGQSLLRRIVHIATTVSPHVATVLGADSQIHQQEIADLASGIVYNPNWEKGMGNSLKCGVRDLLRKHPLINKVIIAVSDQPFLDDTVLFSLLTASESGYSIVASLYGNGILGVPALFDSMYFDELKEIPDDRGAKQLIDKYGAFGVSFPGGSIDIDTDDDWKAFIKE